MSLTDQLAEDRRAEVEGRLGNDLIAWLTTVRPSGQPESVPVWFLVRDDDTILVFSQPDKLKLRNILDNPRIAFSLDGTDVGSDVIRIEGTAARADSLPTADKTPAYAAKYADEIARIFGTLEKFAASYSVPVLITPSKLHA